MLNHDFILISFPVSISENLIHGNPDNTNFVFTCHISYFITSMDPCCICFQQTWHWFTICRHVWADIKVFEFLPPMKAYHLAQYKPIYPDSSCDIQIWTNNYEDNLIGPAPTKTGGGGSKIVGHFIHDRVLFLWWQFSCWWQFFRAFLEKKWELTKGMVS